MTKFGKMMIKVQLPVKTAARKFDCILGIFRFCATQILVNFLEHHLTFSSLRFIVEVAIFS